MKPALRMWTACALVAAPLLWLLGGTLWSFSMPLVTPRIDRNDDYWPAAMAGLAYCVTAFAVLWNAFRRRLLWAWLVLGLVPLYVACLGFLFVQGPYLKLEDAWFFALLGGAAVVGLMLWLPRPVAASREPIE